MLVHFLYSTSDCTLQCGMWLWNRDSEFGDDTKAAARQSIKNQKK